MEIIWDEPKREVNFAHHGIDFADVTLAFFLNAKIADAKSGRFQALGRLEGRAIVAIFARLGSEALSIISARPANRKERRQL